MFEEYLLSFHRDELLDILANQNQTRHFSININFIELLGRKIELAKDLLDDPDKSLEEWEKAATAAQLTLLKQVERKFELKLNAHCRIYYLAHLARHYIFPGEEDVGKFIQISGTVMRLTAAKCLEFQRNYVCTSCKTPVLVKADYNRKYNIIKQPARCQNPDCNSTNLIHFGELDSDNCKDYQEIKVQEQVNKLGIGSIPNTLKVTFEDDLVDSCQPGDDVTICGIVKRQFGEFNVGKKIEIDLVFKANHVQVDTNSSFSISTPETKNMFNSFWEKYSQNTLEGRDIILKSFCTKLYGLYPVKLALAVVLAGGCPIEDINVTGVRTRSESHLLLVGDPGTGKSHLLRFASKLVPRAVLTTGVGSTAAGLTVTATMEHGEWQLEAGALVMADGGICCIDEFNSMKEHDRTTIHEAMEQQTISVAKASMVCKLNSRCSILAACNPKGNLDPTQPLSMNVALPSPLLSRFDLVMLLRDTVDQEWNGLVMDYILNGGNHFSKLTEVGFWPINILQSYFKIIKNLRPKLTEDAKIILSSYYNLQRKLTSRNKARTTVRLLESLVRLSQGHARLMYHEKVLVIDSIYAVFLVDFSMDHESSIFNLNMPSNTVFPERPKSEYRDLLETVLSKLQLLQILNKELDKLKSDGDREGILQSRFFANAQIVDKNSSNENNAEAIASSSRRNENKAQEHSVTKFDSERVVNEEDKNNNENRDEGEAAKNINKNRKKCNTINENPKKINKNHNKTIEDDNVSDIIAEKCNNTSVSSEDMTKSKKPKLSNKNYLKRISSEANRANNDMELKKGPSSVNDNLDWDSERVVDSSQSSIKLIVSKRVVNEEDNKNDNGNKAEEEEAKNIGRNKKKCDAYKKNPEKININHNKTVRNANININHNKTVRNANIKQFEDKSGSSKKNVEITAEYSKRDKNDGQQHNASKHDTKQIVNDDEYGGEEKEEKNINKNVKKNVFNKFNPNKNHNKTVTTNNESDKNVNMWSENAKSKKTEDSINDPGAETFSVSSDDITSKSKKPKLSNENSLKRIKSKANSVYNDMELLKWVPSVNDGFCADLDLDWDSEGAVEDSQSSTKLIDSTSSSHSKLSNLNIFNSCEDIDFDIEI